MQLVAHSPQHPKDTPLFQGVFYKSRNKLFLLGSKLSWGQGRQPRNWSRSPPSYSKLPPCFRKCAFIGSKLSALGCSRLTAVRELYTAMHKLML